VVRKVVHMHSDGRVEVVELREKCGERDEGGAAFEVFVPSLERETETDFVFGANVETRCQGLELIFSPRRPWLRAAAAAAKRATVF
jgi:hypothetical protein